MIIFKQNRVRLSLIFLIMISMFTVSPFSASAFEEKFQNSKQMEFVLIKPGTFVMGSPGNEPHRGDDEIQRKVIITKPFYMMTTEVTKRHWQNVMGKGLFGRWKKGKELPKVKVSWFNCMKFIDKLNKLNEGVYRLATEAEWEYAARAGSAEAFSWGNSIDCSKAMYANNSSGDKDCMAQYESRGFQKDSAAPVKSFPPNPWGLYDMHGNVWEWCEDSWHNNYEGAPDDGSAWPGKGSNRVRRGGSWFYPAQNCRLASRSRSSPSNRYNILGFRVARSFVGK